MEMLIKAAAVCLPAAVVAAVIKKDNPSAALILCAAAGCVVLYIAMDAFSAISDILTGLADRAGMESAVFKIILKTVGISVITRLSADICSDAGMKSASSSVELLGAASALYVALPLIATVFDMVEGLL